MNDAHPGMIQDPALSLLDADLLEVVESTRRSIWRLPQYPGQLGKLPTSIVDPALDLHRASTQHVVDRLKRALQDGHVSKEVATKLLETSVDQITEQVMQYVDHLGHRSTAWNASLEVKNRANKRLVDIVDLLEREAAERRQLNPKAEIHEETLRRLGALIDEGRSLAPSGGSAFQGYNGKLQPKFLAWRSDALAAFESAAPLGAMPRD